MFTPFIAPITKKSPIMPLRYGYEMEGQTPGHPARLVIPPLLNKTITLNPTTATNKWIFIGTRLEIIEWMRSNAQLVLENSQWSDSTRPSLFHTQQEIVIDLLQYADPEQSTYDYVKTYFVADHTTERVRVEFRPKIEKHDYNTFTLCRVIVNSGITIGDIVDELESRWSKPAPWLITQVGYHVVLDQPGPETVLSSDVPTSIVVEDTEVVSSQPVTGNEIAAARASEPAVSPFTIEEVEAEAAVVRELFSSRATDAVVTN